MTRKTNNFPSPDVPALPGFDLEAALVRGNGDWESLKSQLMQFLEVNREANGVLRSLLEDGETTRAKNLLQQLQEQGASVGAFALMDVAAALENSLSSGARELPSSRLSEFALCVGQLAEAECVLKAMDTDASALEAEFAPHPLRGADIEDVESCLHTIESCLRRDLRRVEGEIGVLLAHCRGSEMEELAVHLQNEFNAFNLAEISRTINQYFVSAR